MILVVFVFLRDARATLIPSVAVPVSLIGTFGVMYLFGYSLDNLSLMALTIATGFVVDDAIVVIENITPAPGEGHDADARRRCRGPQEIGFTVLSISISLVAVFIPILLMGGIVGRLFREFAVTLSVAIVVSLVVSLTTTPMMCAVPAQGAGTSRSTAGSTAPAKRVFDWILALLRDARLRLGAHGISSSRCSSPCRRSASPSTCTSIVPKGFFPQQDTGRLTGNDHGRPGHLVPGDGAAAASGSRRSCSEDPGVDKRDRLHRRRAAAATPVDQHAAAMFITLKPHERRRQRACHAHDQRRRGHRPAAAEAGRSSRRRRSYLQAVQDLRDRRPLEQRAVSVHPAGRQPRTS